MLLGVALLLLGALVNALWIRNASSTLAVDVPAPAAAAGETG
jgi:hypothetical protein